ncbi:hypothetical protein SAMN05660226_01436 [Parapedobacter luteus]|uniref:Uncharacterized protein n=1 Tax=Parapedobacter luteus TaxID=623280 RepID=A0A1T5BFM0_9SPHI|nr:hypothetical protein SAMN05660226_01436 [Parapedobacter luteus]
MKRTTIAHRFTGVGQHIVRRLPAGERAKRLLCRLFSYWRSRHPRSPVGEEDKNIPIHGAGLQAPWSIFEPSEDHHRRYILLRRTG